MIKKLIPILCVASIFFGCDTKKSDQTSDAFYMPAEWEPHEAVWFGWEEDANSGFYPAIGKIITTLKPHVAVKIAFDNDSLKESGMATLHGLGVDTTGIKTYIMPGERYWIRDHGAAFLVNGIDDLGVADFGWDHYGYPAFLELKYEGNKDSVDAELKRRQESRLKTGSVDSLMAVAEGAVILKTDVVHEGGAIEVNGKGTLILCEATVFQRNPDMDRESIESEFKRVLGVSHVIWMKQGLADDPHWFLRRIVGDYIGGGTGGHTDEFVRFANANTILLAWVDEAEKDLNPINRMNYERMSENYRILSNAKDQDGQPFEIIKVPLPDLIPVKVVVREDVNWKELEDFTLDVNPDWFVPSEAVQVGDTLLRVPAASYMNFLVTNGLVLLPSYTAMGSSPEKEAEVKEIFEQQFPGREVVFFNVMMQNWDGGGIHCSTQQQPRRMDK